MGSTERPRLSEGNVKGTPDTTYRHPLTGDPVTFKGDEGLEGGAEIYDDILAELRTGIPKELRALIESQTKGAISGNLKSGEEKLNRTFAKEGDVPIGAKTDAISRMREGANKSLSDLYLNLGEMDYKARNNAFSKYGDLLRLAMEKGRMGNQSKLAGYQIDKDSEFDWGDALGGLFGTGGNILGGLASGGYL